MGGASVWSEIWGEGSGENNMIHVYIAGRFTAPTEEEIEQNILAAEAVAREIISASDRFVCLVPHSLGRMFKRGPGYPDYWYRATASMLHRCDAILMVEGWKWSKGSIAEKIWAQDNGMPIFFSVSGLLDAEAHGELHERMCSVKVTEAFTEALAKIRGEA
jgi:hypothetical protein